MDSSRVVTLVGLPPCVRPIQSPVSGQPGIEAIGVATVGPDMFAQMQAASPDMMLVETGGEEWDRLVAQAPDSVPDGGAVSLTFADECTRGQRVPEDALGFALDSCGTSLARFLWIADQPARSRYVSVTIL